MPVTLHGPTFEHHREALGIGEASPRISWRFESDDKTKNWLQESYEIEISQISSSTDSQSEAKPKNFTVNSTESVLVPWPSKPLKSRERASVRVRAKDFNGAYTPWSDSSSVEIGLLGSEDWTAQVIGADKTLAPTGALRPALFRRGFSLANKELATARLYITSYGVYEASINGSRVGDHVLAPGWQSYKHRLCYQTHDVTSLLKEGKNAIGVEVGDGWYCGRLGFNGGRRFIYGDQLAVLAQLEVMYKDGSTETVTSDQNWKSSVGARIASEIYDGEIYDVSQVVKSWDSGKFDDVDWKAASVLGFPAAELVAPEGPPIRKTETVKPKSIWKSPTDKVIVDFGQNLVGGIRLRVPNKKGQEIVLKHVEVLEHAEIATRPLRDCKATDTIILSGEGFEWEPKFTFHGFRYAQIEGWPSDTGEPSLNDLEAVVIHTDMEATGSFECNEEMVNQLYRNIHWGMRGNFVGLPTDCPQRDERLGWTGDINIFSPTANFLYDTSGLLSSWLKDLAAEQIKNYQGIVPQVVPDVIDFPQAAPLAVWGDAAVMTPWDLYLNFGDKNILKTQYESIQSWYDHIPKDHATGLWDPSHYQLGDWLDPAAPPDAPADGRTDPQFIANGYLVHIAELLATISRVLGHSNEAVKKLEDVAESAKASFQYEYVTSAGRLAPDTMTSISLALTFELFSSQDHADKARARLARLSRASRFRIGTGFVGTPIILPALCSGGTKSFKQVAYRMLLEKGCPSWLYPITMGGTTMWERWDSMLPNGDINPGSMTSFNHYALGSVGKWVFGSVGGVDMIAPQINRPRLNDKTDFSTVGWRLIRFAPLPGGTITSAKTSHLSPYGKVSCEWSLDVGAKIFKMVVEVPPNCTGKVELPGTAAEPVTIGSGFSEFVVEGYEESQPWPPERILDPFAMYED